MNCRVSNHNLPSRSKISPLHAIRRFLPGIKPTFVWFYFRLKITLLMIKIIWYAVCTGLWSYVVRNCRVSNHNPPSRSKISPLLATTETLPGIACKVRILPHNHCTLLCTVGNFCICSLNINIFGCQRQNAYHYEKKFFKPV